MRNALLTFSECFQRRNNADCFFSVFIVSQKQCAKHSGEFKTLVKRNRKTRYPLLARKASWVPHIFRPTSLNGRGHSYLTPNLTYCFPLK